MADSSKQGTGGSLSEDAGYQTIQVSGPSGITGVAGSLAWALRVAVTSPLVVIASLLSGALVVYGIGWFPNSLVLRGVVELAVEVLAATAIVAAGRASFFPASNDLGSVLRLTANRLPHVAGFALVAVLGMFAILMLGVLVSWLVSAIILLVSGLTGLLSGFAWVGGEVKFPLQAIALAYLGVRTVLAVPAIVVEGIDTLDGIAFGWVGSRDKLVGVVALLALALVDTTVRAFVLPVGDTVSLAVNVVLSAAVVAVAGLAVTRFWMAVREEFAEEED